MKFERESEGIYRYGKKRVFMKIEKDQIIIRVGGGYLTIEEFIEQYFEGEINKKKLYGLIYGGGCAGSKDFKTFYFTQKNIKEEPKQGETACDEEEEENEEQINIVDDMIPKDQQK